MSKLIHFYSMDFDKKCNRIKSRELLQIDDSTDRNLEHGPSYFERITSSKMDLTVDSYEKGQRKLKNVIENERLFEVLKKLSTKQIRILELMYIDQYSNKEIALILNESDQTISYNHKAALNKLEGFLIKKT